MLQEPGEGKINTDLPSCWECPKCYQNTGSASEVQHIYTHLHNYIIKLILIHLSLGGLVMRCFIDFLMLCDFWCTNKLTFQYQSSSEEESAESDGSTFLPEPKLGYQEGNGAGDGVKRSKRSRPPGRPTAPPPSQKLLLQHQQSRKRESALEYRLKKRVHSTYFECTFSVFFTILKVLLDLYWFNVFSFYIPQPIFTDKTGEDQTFKSKKWPYFVLY